MVQCGLSSFRQMEVIFTQKKCLETRSEAEPLKIVNYKKFDSVITITNDAVWSIAF